MKAPAAGCTTCPAGAADGATAGAIQAQIHAGRRSEFIVANAVGVLGPRRGFDCRLQYGSGRCRRLVLDKRILRMGPDGLEWIRRKFWGGQNQGDAHALELPVRKRDAARGVSVCAQSDCDGAKVRRRGGRVGGWVRTARVSVGFCSAVRPCPRLSARA